MLQTAVAGAGAALGPWAELFAQTAGALSRAPKQALVIGIGRYKQSPLKNPVNDARGMAAALKSTGFNVTLGLELTQANLREAINAYGESLIKAKAVGLFYFAGHGVQLDWRNYLIPVDAEILSIEQLRARAIDVNTLIEGIRKAGNPMNIIILDACRDNPFAGEARVEQRGLAQLDAPPGTLLAYATSPGNTANDGEGDNGLYTEHLLREIRVPETKVEDVFKRVRLGVRRRSNGQQIPWESTSLEEDFWFLPPKQVNLAESAKRELNQEMALWDKVKGSSDPRPLENYLIRYSSGHFSELAQLRLDQALVRQGEKKIRIASTPQNPYSRGTAVADINRKVGDSYTYGTMDLGTKEERTRFTRTITRVTDKEVVYDDGLITDLLGNLLRYPAGQRAAGTQFWAVEYAIGKRWRTLEDTTGRSGALLKTDRDVRVVARERIAVPAGVFEAFVLEVRGSSSGGRKFNELQSRRWIAPDRVRSVLVIETVRQDRTGRVVPTDRRELVAYRQF